MRLEKNWIHTGLSSSAIVHTSTRKYSVKSTTKATYLSVSDQYNHLNTVVSLVPSMVRCGCSVAIFVNVKIPYANTGSSRLCSHQTFRVMQIDVHLSRYTVIHLHGEANDITFLIIDSKTERLEFNLSCMPVYTYSEKEIGPLSLLSRCITNIRSS